ncbi:MAG TPA: DUF4179 domain-containing protein [Anaerolineales bacterium]|nr:DUF4179 domain-containing protein [Anaerolineales bacterium]
MSDLNPSPEFEEKVRKAMDVPNANPAFVNKLRNDLARRPVKMKPIFFRPAWAGAFVLALAVLVVSVPSLAAALGRVFGYVPEVGLVETTNGLRMLAEPVSSTRDGVTLTITNVFAYPDHVELQYEVSGLAPENDGWQSNENNTNPTAFCGGVNVGDTHSKAGDARLRLQDGTVLERDYTGKYPKNAFAMQPVYDAALPAGVTSLTFVLDCIPQARLGAVPENWQINFDLIVVPEGTVIGEPVIEVNVTSEPVGTENVVTDFQNLSVKLERVVEIEQGYIFYLSVDMDHPDPLLVSIMPANVYVIDSLGQKIQLVTFDPMHPIDHPLGSAFEYQTISKPADGQLTLVVEDVIAHFDPPWINPISGPSLPQNGTFFNFDVGSNPQHGQAWKLDEEFNVASYPLRVTSVRAIKYDDLGFNNDPFGSQGFDYGYQFTVETDESNKMNVALDIVNQDYINSCLPVNMQSFMPEGSSMQYNILCRDGFPKGSLAVAVREVSVVGVGEWSVAWSPNDALTSGFRPIAEPAIKMILEKVVPTDSSTIIYLHLNMENADPSLMYLVPQNAYVIDSSGQQIHTRGNFTIEPHNHRVGDSFEFVTEAKPADGALTVVVDQVIAYYRPMYVDPPLATPEEMTFTFDAGENPQYGQVWDLNKTFTIAGYSFEIVSAQAVNYADIEKVHNYVDGSQGYDFGYQFSIEIDPPLGIAMDIIRDNCGFSDEQNVGASPILYTQLCRDGYPSGNVAVTISEISITINEDVQVGWNP